jgi:hypothetical protein
MEWDICCPRSCWSTAVDLTGRSVYPRKKESPSIAYKRFSESLNIYMIPYQPTTSGLWERTFLRLFKISEQ